MVISKHETIRWENVEILQETMRGEGGFGHTGKKITKK
jgi:dUTP pyrophosphatase